MPSTIGYHWVKSGYGLWLPGDARGHWSTEWDSLIGYYEPHMLHEGDPDRARMAAERMKHPPTRLNRTMIEAVRDTMNRCAASSDWRIMALTIQRTHVHVLLTYTTRNIGNTVKWLSDQTTKAAKRAAGFGGPIWCKGRWLQFVYDEAHWQRLIEYIGRHDG
jgi:REP element-mobilizing transposase RayT